MAAALMAGKRGLIMGLANDKSIAWGTAKALHDAGAELAISYTGDAVRRRAEPLAASLGVTEVIECDVSEPESLDRLFDRLSEVWGRIDFVVHAIAFSDKDELRDRYIDTSPANFRRSSRPIKASSATPITCAKSPEGI